MKFDFKKLANALPLNAGPHRSRFSLILSIVLLAGVVGVFAVGLAPRTAAQQTNGQPNLSTAAAISRSDDKRYRIGPGDVLEIRVLKAPELSREAVRVDQRGMIRMPLIRDEILAACSTEIELAQKIATLYLEYKRNPNVDVFIKDYQSQPIAIVGALSSIHPDGTQFRLHRRVRLLEILALAGGLSERAGAKINVVHAGGADLCAAVNNESNAQVDPTNEGGLMVTYNLIDTMRGVPEANPLLRPGDIVVVPEGEQIYVVGNVLKPSTIHMKEPLTVSRAIAIAGGTRPDTKKDKVRILRQTSGSGVKQEIVVDLTAIEKQKAPDMLLLANDIVDVPTSSTRSFLRSLMGAVAPAVSQMPVRVIP